MFGSALFNSNRVFWLEIWDAMQNNLIMHILYRTTCLVVSNPVWISQQCIFQMLLITVFLSWWKMVLYNHCNMNLLKKSSVFIVCWFSSLFYHWMQFSELFYLSFTTSLFFVSWRGVFFLLLCLYCHFASFRIFLKGSVNENEKICENAICSLTLMNQKKKGCFKFAFFLVEKLYFLGWSS